jgi:hypothetical protein
MTAGTTPWNIGLNSAGGTNAWHALRSVLLFLGTAASICLFDRFTAVIAVSLVWFPYVLFHPREGLWISPSFIMLAGLVCPPEGFVLGAGYSPELGYWAVGVAVLFVPMLVRYLQPPKRPQFQSPSGEKLSPPRSFYAFVIISIIATVVGLAHGYPLLNVAKQLFGCVLLCAYFLFVLRFAPTQEDMEHIIRRLCYVAVVCSVVYLAMALSLVAVENFSTHLTPIAFYDGALVVLLIPLILRGKGNFRVNRMLILALFLFLVPLLTQMKRIVVACFLCGLLAWGLRSASRRKRYSYLLASFVILVILVSTSVLNPIGTWLSKYESLKNFFPEDVQSHYSVFLRLEEFRQVVGTFGDSPILGGGLGSTLNWYDPITKNDWEMETVADGPLYLLVKMGIAGTIIFMWFISTLGRAALRKRITGLHLALFLLFIFHLLQMIADVTFFYFITAGWVGATCAFLYIFNKNSEMAPAESVSRVP